MVANKWPHCASSVAARAPRASPPRRRRALRRSVRRAREYPRGDASPAAFIVEPAAAARAAPGCCVGALCRARRSWARTGKATGARPLARRTYCLNSPSHSHASHSRQPSRSGSLRSGGDAAAHARRRRRPRRTTPATRERRDTATAPRRGSCGRAAVGEGDGGAGARRSCLRRASSRTQAVRSGGAESRRVAAARDSGGVGCVRCCRRGRGRSRRRAGCRR